MTADSLLGMLTQPEMLRQVSISDLRRMVEAYPCFAMAGMLYVKALKMQGDLDYSRELFKASLQAPSRRQLFYCINDRFKPDSLADVPYFDVYKIDDNSKTNVPEKERLALDEGFMLVDRFLDKFDSDNRDLSLSGTSVYSLEDSLGDGSDIVEENELIRNFVEHSSNNCAVVEDSEKETVDDAQSGDDPIIPSGAFTLTLANIYIKQKKYEQALEIFKSIVLKNPEKSIYFAEQIKYLEKVINHLNK